MAPRSATVDGIAMRWEESGEGFPVVLLHGVPTSPALWRGVMQIAAVRNPEICAGLFLTNSIGYDSWPIPSVKAMQALSALVARLPRAIFWGIFSTFLQRGHDDVGRARAAIEVH